MKQNFTLILVFVGILSLLYVLDNKASRTNIYGTQEKVKKLNSNHVNMNFNPELFNLGKGGGTIIHEMFHTLKDIDAITYDIPIASSIGFYYEKLESGKLSTSELSDSYRKGTLVKGNIRFEKIDSVTKIYRNINQPEIEKSYIDGAFIAGIMSTLYPSTIKPKDLYEKGIAPRDKESGDAFQFAFCLGLGLNSNSCSILSRSSIGFNILEGMKRGGYNDFNNELFFEHSKDLSEPEKIALNEYKEVLEDFCLIFSKNKIGTCNILSTELKTGNRLPASNTR